MSPKRLDRLRSILVSALHMPAEGRAAFVASECGDDVELRAEIEELLVIQSSAGDFLSQSFPELLGSVAERRVEVEAGALLKHRYRIESRMAQSGFATVYLASDELLGNMRVVVKVLDRVSNTAVFQELFQSELKALSRVRHRNVIGISDVGALEEGIPFLVLEFVPGVTLREVLRGGAVPLPRARRILREIGRALSAAHQVGVCHLDLKPENVIVSEAGSDEERVKLIDFGIARFKGLDGVGTFVSGSPNYMAPEQVESPSALCDIYALSLVAFELFTGHLPRHDLSIPKQVPASFGVHVIRAISKGLADDPSSRSSDAFRFAEEIASARPTRRMSWYAALASGIALAAAGFFGLAQMERLQDRPMYATPTLFVNSEAVEHYPAFSPDGSEIYYSVGELGHNDIYKKVLTGGTPVRVVRGPGDDLLPQVSPDGRTLLFVRRGDTKALFQKNLITGQEEELARELDIDSYSWSRDGNRVVLSILNERAPQSLWLLDLRSKQIKPMNVPMASDCGLYHPSLSPDGRFLAFACGWAQGSHDLFLLAVTADLQGVGSVRRLTSRNDGIAHIEWTPDSLHILYVAGPLGNRSIWRIAPFSSSEATPLKEFSGPIGSISIARKQWKLAYSRDLSQTNIWQYELFGSAPPRKLVASGRGDEEGLFSPDGKMLLFGSARSGSAQIWVSNVDGSKARQLTQVDSVEVVAAIWSADSKEAIISVRSKDLGERIYRTPVQRPAALDRLIDGAMALSVSRDGKWLYIVKSAGNQQSILRSKLSDPQITELITPFGAYGQESPDGRTFYFAMKSTSKGICSQPLPRGTVSPVVPRLYRRNLFAVGRTGIFFIAPSEGTVYPSLFFQSYQATAPKRLLAFDRQIAWGLSLSPDERSIVYSQFDVGNYDIFVVDSFR
jgi:Tol biopolymer transport system component